MLARKRYVIIGGVIAAAFAIFAIVYAAQSNLQVMKPISDAELQRKTGELPEVKAFLTKYPDANVQFHQDDKIRTIDYATSLRDNENSPRFLYLLKINIVADKISGDPQNVIFTCTKTDGENSTSYSVAKDIEEEIKAENCIHS